MIQWTTSLLIVVFGVLYPSWLGFKDIETGNPELMRKWCIFWFVLSLAWVAAKVTDRVLFWVPMYDEIKFLFIIYLWHPRFEGATYIYTRMAQPVLSANQVEIDEKLELAKARGKALAANSYQRVGAWATKSMCDLQDYVIAQTQKASGQQQGARQHAAFSKEE